MARVTISKFDVPMSPIGELSTSAVITNCQETSLGRNLGIGHGLKLNGLLNFTTDFIADGING